MDPKYNGQLQHGHLQHGWGWILAAYLFFGGVGAGAYVIAALNGLLGGVETATTVGLWIAFPAVLVGSFFLIADLGVPARAILAGVKPKTSWIARGFWIISIFLVLSFLHLVLANFTSMGESAGGQTLINVIASLGVLFALGTAAYTGILLSASKGIPFWRSGALPIVFVASALVTGQFAIMLGMILFVDGIASESLGTMALQAVVLVVLEVLAIVFFLLSAYREPDSKESAERLLRKPSFVVGDLILGLAVPIVLMSFLYRSPGNVSIAYLGALGALLGIIGGVALRHAILICGALPTLNIAGFEFRRIYRPRDPKPGIGLLPPQ
jgi:formate-dependent nitrite reductase membrane component NrfD